LSKTEITKQGLLRSSYQLLALKTAERIPITILLDQTFPAATIEIWPDSAQNLGVESPKPISTQKVLARGLIRNSAEN
jgi:hypothetical protein